MTEPQVTGGDGTNPPTAPSVGLPSDQEPGTNSRGRSSTSIERERRVKNSKEGGSNNVLVSGMRQQEKGPMGKILPGISSLPYGEDLEHIANYFSNSELIELGGRLLAQDYAGAGKMAAKVMGPQMIREIAEEKDSDVLRKLADAADTFAENMDADDPLAGDDGMIGGLRDKVDSIGTDDQTEADLPSENDDEALALGAGMAGDNVDGISLEDQPSDIRQEGDVITDRPIGEDEEDSSEDDDEDDDDEDDDDDSSSSSNSGRKVIIAIAAVTAPLLIIMLIAAMVAGSLQSRPPEEKSGLIAKDSFCYVDPDAGFSGSEPRAPGQSEQSLVSGGIDNVTIEGLSSDQIKNAAKIYKLMDDKKAGDSVTKAALITAVAETELKNLANDGESTNPAEYKSAVSKSKDTTNQGVKLKGNALGLMGMTYPQWGEVSELMNPDKSAAKFLDAALKVTGYDSKSGVDLAKEVMSPTSPDTYDNASGTADRIFDAMKKAGSDTGGSTGGGAVGERGKGELIQPMAAGTFQQTSGFGERWGSLHDGADWAGTDRVPEYAVADAKVVKSEPASGYGNWIILGITLSNGEYIEALYGHMRAEDMFVKAGDTVTGGQKVALQGSEGQSTGSHLHFGIYPGGWKMGGGVDPLPYMMPEALPLGSDGNLDTSSIRKGGDTPSATSTPKAGVYGEAGAEWDFLDKGGITEKVDSLDERQMRNAREVVRQTEAMGMPKKAAVVALATAMQESTMLIYANSSVPVSLSEPHDAVGQDYDSVGLFQQRYPMWSQDVRQLMTPWSSAELFLKNLKELSGWEDMPITVAAQKVQRSAYPDAYAKWEGTAVQLADKFYDGSGAGASPGKLGKSEGGSSYSMADANGNFTSPDTGVLRYTSDSFCVGKDGTMFKVDDKFATGDQGAYTPGGFRSSVMGDKSSDSESAGASNTSSAALNGLDPKQASDVKPTGNLGVDIVQYGLAWRGTPYAWGGGTYEGPSKGITDNGGAADANGDFNKIGFDCSGLVLYAVYQASGGRIKTAHYTGEQYKGGKPIPMDQIQPGDAIYMGGPVGSPTPDSSHHVVIYMGDGKILHAPQSGDVVKVSELTLYAGEGNYAVRFE